jgi:hypothetical protein
MEAQRVLSRLGFVCRRAQGVEDESGSVATIGRDSRWTSLEERVSSLEAAVGTLEAAVVGLHARMRGLESAP